MKILVLISGGIESTTCLALAVKKVGAENVETISVNYGQKHIKELNAVKNICEYYKVNNETIDLSNILKYSNCSILSHSNIEVEEADFESQKLKAGDDTISSYVPFRNGLMLSAAASYALSKDCSIIYYGAQSNDKYNNTYPDCNLDFITNMNNAIYKGTGDKIYLEAPLIDLNKTEVVKLGLELKVPYKYTWSCYQGKERACGKCGTCIDRINAFKNNGLEDEIDYE